MYHSLSGSGLRAGTTDSPAGWAICAGRRSHRSFCWIAAPVCGSGGATRTMPGDRHIIHQRPEPGKRPRMRIIAAGAGRAASLPGSATRRSDRSPLPPSGRCARAAAAPTATPPAVCARQGGLEGGPPRQHGRTEGYLRHSHDPCPPQGAGIPDRAGGAGVAGHGGHAGRAQPVVVATRVRGWPSRLAWLLPTAAAADFILTGGLSSARAASMITRQFFSRIYRLCAGRIMRCAKHGLSRSLLPRAAADPDRRLNNP